MDVRLIFGLRTWTIRFHYCNYVRTIKVHAAGRSSLSFVKAIFIIFRDNFPIHPLDRAKTAKMSEDGCKLFVYGVGENVSREEMEQEFGRCGSVTDAYNTGKGYAFITMSSPSEAQAAVSQMH